MIKRIVPTLLLVLAFSVVSQAQVKIAVIDLKRAFDEYYKTKDTEKLLQDQVTTVKNEEQELRDDYQKMVEEANKLKDAANDKTLSQSARDDKQKALETKAQDVYNQERKIQEFERVHQQELEDRQHRLRQGIVDDIVKVVNDFGAREKYSLIFDKSGDTVNGTPVLMYSQDVKDITDDVIKLINATKPTGATSAPATTTPTDSAPAPAH